MALISTGDGKQVAEERCNCYSAFTYQWIILSTQRISLVKF